MTDPIVLRNRFAMVKGAWEEQLRGVPFPSLGEGTAEPKIERLELALVDEMRRRATPETAEQVADAMWGIVHARPEDDPVKLRVTRHHEELAKMGHRLREPAARTRRSAAPGAADTCRIRAHRPHRARTSRTTSRGCSRSRAGARSPSRGPGED